MTSFVADRRPLSSPAFSSVCQQPTIQVGPVVTDQACSDLVETGACWLRAHVFKAPLRHAEIGRGVVGREPRVCARKVGAEAFRNFVCDQTHEGFGQSLGIVQYMNSSERKEPSP